MEKQAEKITNLLTQAVFLEMEASGRHVHVTQEQARILFGQELTARKPLSQPGQYVCHQRVTVVGPKGKFEGVAVLGPARKSAQVEISLTDCRTLGIDAPIRLSGKAENTPGCTLVGDRGSITLPTGVIVAQRHVHLDPASAAVRQVRDGDRVKLRTLTGRPLIFDDVVVRVSPDFAPRVHLDYDEANACGFHPGDLGLIVP